MKRALYIDDEIDRENRDAQKIRDLLESTKEIKVELQLPPKDFSHILDDQPDVLLVDLDLSTAEIDGENISYFGSTLAAEMRMRYERCPIVLVTRPQMLSDIGPWTASLLESKVDVDLLMYKDDINQNPEREIRKIVSVVDAFQMLGDVKTRDWKSLVELIGARDEEAGELREASPPMERGSWNIPQVVRWLKNVLVAYPGILYDDLTAATRLGISLESFFQDDVQSLFSSAQYDGIMSGYERRWWRSRLFTTAYQLMTETGITGPLFLKFNEAFHSLYEYELDPAICIYDGEPTANWVCYVLKKPTKQENSVPYYPDSRPPIMDQARVSFKAIMESNDFDETLVDEDSLDVVDKLWG